MSWDGATLEAYCQPLDAKSTSDELSIYTTLDFDTACFPTASVVNNNGYLSCTHAAATRPGLESRWSAVPLMPHLNKKKFIGH